MIPKASVAPSQQDNKDPCPCSESRVFIQSGLWKKGCQLRFCKFPVRKCLSKIVRKIPLYGNCTTCLWVRSPQKISVRDLGEISVLFTKFSYKLPIRGLVASSLMRTLHKLSQELSCQNYARDLLARSLQQISTQCLCTRSPKEVSAALQKLILILIKIKRPPCKDRCTRSP